MADVRMGITSAARKIKTKTRAGRMFWLLQTIG